ncbi:enoyl-CoA hydratase [Lewinella marina]|uniref:Enoyl-CoA hydratase n=1 Tax=Neolewinella marina TaxID=438751 RepID=A0A2G0CF49_9BACT|nr:enoyl-CoA hydratase-related protein [Neolewinella marina]NJB85778.1 enoyl-CoA hydratase [Neolewinella marina]PHK98550.1 enoyl-CoA hydratase [Neolewinella marina]
MIYRAENGIAHLTFDRSDRANALDLPAWHAMREAFERAGADESVRVIILRGAGKHFCAGMDLSVLQDMQARFRGDPTTVREQVREFITDLQDCINAIERCPQPVIAAVQGGCIGGGVDIITACDLRYCVKSASFSVKEVDLGIVADLGTLQRLPYLVNPGIAAELAYTGRTFQGEEAAQIGLVNEALSNEGQLEYRVGIVADAIAAKPARIIAGIKRSLLQQRGRILSESLPFVANLSATLIAGLDR